MNGVERLFNTMCRGTRRRLSVAACCGVAVLLLAACGAAKTSQPRTTTPSGPPKWAVQHTYSFPQLTASSGVSALAAGAGRIFVLAGGEPATHRQGVLLTVNAGNGRVLYTSPAGGDPGPAAWEAGRLWVANGSLGEIPGVAGANTVSELGTTDAPALEGTYDIADPWTVAPAGSDAWTLTGGIGAVPTRLVLLGGGSVRRSVATTGALAGPAGASGAAVVCNGKLFFAVLSATSGSTRVDERNLATGAAIAKFPLPVSGETTLTCSAGREVVAGVSAATGGGLFVLGHGGVWQRIPRSPSYFSALTSTGRTVWVVTQTPSPAGSPAGRASALAYRNGRLQVGVALPRGNTGPATVLGNDLWCVVGNKLVEIGRS